MGAQKVEVIASLASLPVISRNGAQWGSQLERIVPAVQRAGYSGLQVWPHHRITRGITGANYVPSILSDWVHSLHQTARLPGIPGKAMGFWVPDSVDSIASIKEIEQVLPQPVPAVLFPRTILKTALEGGRFTEDNTGATVRGAQLEAKVLNELALTSAEAYMEHMDRIGLPYYVDDPIHSYIGADDTTQGIRTALLQSGRAIQLHVPGDRGDLKKRNSSIETLSRESARVFIEDSLAQAKDTWLGRLVVDTISNVELAPEANGVLPIVPEHKPPYIGSAAEFYNVHAPFVERIQQLAEHAGATVTPQPELPWDWRNL